MAMISFSFPSPAKLPIKSPPSISNRINVADRLILRHLNAGDLRGAVSALDLMARDGIRPMDSVTFSSLLKSCIRARHFRLGKLVHARLIEFEIEPDSVLYNSLISLYSKSGDLTKAKDVFETMGRFGKRDVVSWSAMMACFGNNGREFDAIKLFVEFLEMGLVPNDYCYTAVIRACSNSDFVGVGRVILGFLMKTGHFESDVCVGCSLIDMFVKGENSFENAYKVFDKMSELNVVTWTLMITRCMQMGFPREAIRFFLDMVLSGFESDKFTLSSVFSACAELENLSLGRQLHSWAIRSGLADDVECSLVDMYAKCSADGSVDDCRKVFDRMQDHSVMSWTALITGYMQNCNLATEAINLFSEMITQGHVEPNHFTFSSAFKACGNVSDPRVGKQVLGHAFKRGLASNSSVSNSVISMFVKCDRMEDARTAFESLSEKNLVSYNTFLDGTCRNLDFEHAFELLSEIAERELGVSAFTFASLLSGVANVGSLRKGEQIHSQVLKLGLSCNQPVCNALISMYSKCGSIDTASRVFSLMDNRNVISWTSMITGFAKHGFAERVLETFNQMTKEGVKPNEVTYVAILSACSHVGLVSEGWRHFNSMYEDHKIKPKMEHYACMVDLLCRAGLLTDAFEFINTMPFQADVLVWRTFLGACRVHSNTELGKLAARKILEFDPNEPAAYIQLSNIYASAGKWEESTEMRRKMKERNLVKEGGCSWIEVGDKVHKFYVGDTSHPNAHQIYDELDWLITEIKRCGYVPDTDLVLHKLEEEDDEAKKEMLLYQHSEKIAVAFGLISTAKSRPMIQTSFWIFVLLAISGFSIMESRIQNNVGSTSIESNKGIEYLALNCRKHRAVLTDFGAIGDGKTSNTKAFREAITKLTTKAVDGGVQLIVPPGNWLTGSFNLTSHFTLFIQQGATILASQDESEYPMIPPLPSYGEARFTSLIYGSNLTDVVITDVTLINTQSAIRIKTAVGRGGYVKNIFARRFTMKTMKYVFWMTGSYKLHPVGGFDPKALPEISNINYRDMTAENVTISAKLEGIKNDPFTGLCMSNVTIALSPDPKKLQWNCTDVSGVTSRVKPEPCSLLPDKGTTMDCDFPTDKIPIESVVLNKCYA
ncbi:hypothetical protein ARALYDRAFT_323502 [Arabidopsis lyrata subsp. lyrata]|uniref:DYW domain-containing protein n=1 Tax=Arabidopsis lyrata subsp. lyrata TaxID=81972 RepID=D7LSF2_ARALL|nr:hypothetical protein ARALYDRAFT_323502 [Arabidopsis lyrata subsp. lyrata]